MTANDRFEIIADVFHAMTGFLAPGKDAPMECGPSIEERGEVYAAWSAQYGEVIHHVLCAVENRIAPSRGTALCRQCTKLDACGYFVGKDQTSCVLFSANN